MPCQLFTWVPEVLPCVVLLTCLFIHCESETQDVRVSDDTYNVHRYKRSTYGEDESPFLEPGVIIGITVGVVGVLVVVGVSVFLCRFLCCKHASCCSCCSCGDRWEMHDIQESDLVPSKVSRDEGSPSHSVNSARDYGFQSRHLNPRTGRSDKPATAKQKPPDYYDEFPRNTRKPKDSKNDSSEGSDHDVNVGNSVRNDSRYDSDEVDHSPRFLHTAALSKRKAKATEEEDDDGSAANSPGTDLRNDFRHDSDDGRRSPVFLHSAAVAKRKAKEESVLHPHRSGTPASSVDSSDRDKGQSVKRAKPPRPNRRYQNYDNEPPQHETGRELPTQDADTAGAGADSQPPYEAAGFDARPEFSHQQHETSYNLSSSYPISVISDFNETASMQHHYGVEPYQGGHFSTRYHHPTADPEERSGVDRLPPPHHRQQNVYNPQHFLNTVLPERADNGGSGDREFHPHREGRYGRDQSSSGPSWGIDSGNPSRTRPNRPRPAPRERGVGDTSASSVSSDRRKPACAVRLFNGSENLAFNPDSTETSV